jgi:hypothetical protein
MAERQPKRDLRGQHGWAEASTAGDIRTKAGLEASAQAGAMPRLARVMKSR